MAQVVERMPTPEFKPQSEREVHASDCLSAAC
jgi:hypothetical protein